MNARWDGQRAGIDRYIAMSTRVREEGGVLYWTNGRRAGFPVKPDPSKGGYLRFGNTGQKMLIHRMVWFLNTGKLPRFTIDHINDNPSDNRFENLRDVPQKLNNHYNKRLAAADTPPPGCVRYNGSGWTAAIYVGRPTGSPKSGYFHLGTFDTEAEASAAYKAARRLFERFTARIASVSAQLASRVVAQLPGSLSPSPPGS